MWPRRGIDPQDLVNTTDIGTETSRHLAAALTRHLGISWTVSVHPNLEKAQLYVRAWKAGASGRPVKMTVNEEWLWEIERLKGPEATKRFEAELVEPIRQAWEKQPLFDKNRIKIVTDENVPPGTVIVMGDDSFDGFDVERQMRELAAARQEEQLKREEEEALELMREAIRRRGA